MTTNSARRDLVTIFLPYFNNSSGAENVRKGNDVHATSATAMIEVWQTIINR